MKLINSTARINGRRKANRAEVAEFFGVNLTTVDQWIRKDCPIVARGSRGIAWEFDLLAVARWRFSGMGAAPIGDDPETLEPKARLDFYRGNRERTRHLEECGELMRVSDHQSQMASVLKILATTIESLPDVLERDAGITGEAVARCQLICDRVREGLYRRLLELTDATEAKPD